MNIVNKKIMNSDEFGNINFVTIKQYYFDKYLFNYIKSFLFKYERKKKHAILSLEHKKKYKIRNKKKHGLYIDNSKYFDDCPDNQIIQITPFILDLNVKTNKVFIEYYVVNDMFICDIYDNQFGNEDKYMFTCTKHVQFEGPDIETFNIYNSNYLTKTAKKIATIYLDKKYKYLIQDIRDENDEKIFYKYQKPIYRNLTEQQASKIMNLNVGLNIN